MDPLHPMVQIRPTDPPPPESTRVRRVQRDQQRDADPDWQEAEEDQREGTGHADDDQEDGYEPGWDGEQQAVAYTHDGLLRQTPLQPYGQGSEPQAARPWNPRRDRERRRAEPSDRSGGAPSEVPDAGHTDAGHTDGGHIDITA